MEKNKVISLIKNVTKKIVLEEIKKQKSSKLEGLTVENCPGVERDDLKRFYIVVSPTKETNEDIMFETDLFNFTEQIKSGKIKIENIKGIIKKPLQAERLKNKLLRERNNNINDAKKSAEKLKNLRDEVKNKTNILKQTKLETENKLSKLK